jgi:hypothetical protein
VFLRGLLLLLLLATVACRRGFQRPARCDGHFSGGSGTEAAVRWHSWSRERVISSCEIADGCCGRMRSIRIAAAQRSASHAYTSASRRCCHCRRCCRGRWSRRWLFGALFVRRSGGGGGRSGGRRASFLRNLRRVCRPTMLS